MEEPKTLSYDVAVCAGRNYFSRVRQLHGAMTDLYIGLYHMEDGYPERFADLTVNLHSCSAGRCE